MIEVDEMIKAIAEYKKLRKEMDERVIQAADRVDRIREVKRAESNRPG